MRDRRSRAQERQLTASVQHVSTQRSICSWGLGLFRVAGSWGWGYSVPSNSCCGGGRTLQRDTGLDSSCRMIPKYRGLTVNTVCLERTQAKQE